MTEPGPDATGGPGAGDEPAVDPVFEAGGSID